MNTDFYTVTLITRRIWNREEMMPPDEKTISDRKIKFDNNLNRRFDNYIDAYNFEDKIVKIVKLYKNLFDTVTNNGYDIDYETVSKRLGNHVLNENKRLLEELISVYFHLCTFMAKYNAYYYDEYNSICIVKNNDYEWAHNLKEIL